ncbi:MAG TPA: hypothetical protein VEJ68_05710, partial [Candidatus Bathyarchaeia archaeon]|nr:hypothetical protein [Candidatus Bathyarchaeia archaeon]
MSSPKSPDDKSKPVLKDKNPHNYRKVGFSMIVISVSLVIIGLVVWGIGSDYHFASNIMAAQEVDAMTPKAGYQIVLYDYSQPIGAKLKLLDHADSLDAAQALQQQYVQQNTDAAGQVLVFGTSKDDNVNLMANAEVAAQTPKHGYNTILFNTAYPVGAKLTNVKHDESLANATQYEQLQVDQNKDPDVKVLIFTPVYTDNLKAVTGSSVPVAAFAAFANQTSAAANPPPATQNPPAVVNNTNTNVPPVIASNQTVSTSNQTASALNQTTIVSNQTGSNVEQSSV